MKRPTPWYGHVAFLIVVAAALLLLYGCGSKREERRHTESEETQVEKETTTHQRVLVGPDGALIPVTEVTTRYREQVTKAQAATEIKSQTTIVPPPIMTAGLQVAGALAAGTPWGTIVAGISTALCTAAAGYAAVQRTRANEHKADADEGWNRALGKPEPVTKESRHG